MVDLVLNNLCRPAGEVLRARLHVQGLILNFDGLIALTLTGAAEQREASFFGIVGLILFKDDRIHHHCVGRGSSALVQESDDAFSDSYHIRSHTDTGLSMSRQGLKEVIS